MTKTSNRTKAKKTAGRGKPADRQGDKRKAPGQAGGIDLLRIADKAGLQRYAAEGLTNSQQRAMASLQRIIEGGMSYDKFLPSDWILLIQHLQNSGKLSSDEAFAGIDSNVHEIAWVDAEILRLSKAIDDLYKEYGAAEDEHWPDGEAPEDMEELRAAFDRRYLQLKVAILRHHGENEMAALLLNDPSAYDDQAEKGRKIFEDNHAAGKYVGKVNDDKAK